MGLLPPQAYKDRKTNGKKKYTAKWYSKQVLIILENEVHMGCIVQGRADKMEEKMKAIEFEEKQKEKQIRR